MHHMDNHEDSEVCLHGLVQAGQTYSMQPVVLTLHSR